MDNIHLLRRIDRFKLDFESIIDELVSEIENKEGTINELDDQITKLKEQIDNAD